MARRPPLPVRSNVAPSLTWFQNPNDPTGANHPIIAFVAPSNNQVTLIDPNFQITPNTGSPAFLMAGPGGTDTPVVSAARPSIAAVQSSLYLAWTDMSGVVHLATSPWLNGTPVRFGNEVTISPNSFLSSPSIGPTIGSANVGAATSVFLYWITHDGLIAVTANTFPVDARPWSPVTTLSETSFDSVGLTTVPQFPAAAEEAQAVALCLAWVGTGGQTVNSKQSGDLSFEQSGNKWIYKFGEPGGPRCKFGRAFHLLFP